MKKVIDTILDFFPLIAPIPTAWAIASALDVMLHWHIIILVIAAIAIESTGFVAADTASKYYEFNRTSKSGETKAPAWLAYTTLGLYVAVTVTMTFMYEPMAAIFPGLSAVGFLLFVLRQDQQAREASRVADRAALLAKREQEKLEKKQEKLAKAKAELAISKPEQEPEQIKPAFVCSCGYVAKSQLALNAHQRKHKQIAGYAVSFEPIKQEQTK